MAKKSSPRALAIRICKTLYELKADQLHWVGIDGGTELTLIHEHLPDEEACKSNEKGWNGLLDKLPVFLGDAEWPT
jgi:hypothetical protein